MNVLPVGDSNKPKSLFCPMEDNRVAVIAAVAVLVILAVAALYALGSIRISGFAGNAAFAGSLFALATFAVAVVLVQAIRADTSVPVHPFKVNQPQGKPAYHGQFQITTANVGMLPSWVNRLQRIFTRPSFALLSPASQRAQQVAGALAVLGSPIICCQEVFDLKAAKIIGARLESEGYTVLHSGGMGWRPVNSGLLFATRYPVNLDGVEFWRFNRLSHEDALSSKGVLRVPLQVPNEAGGVTTVIVYNTHLQAISSEREVRRDELTQIRGYIQRDQELNPAARIFLVGDLNISEREYSGEMQGEYSENGTFFSIFHDFINLTYDDRTGQRRNGVSEPNEPDGTFYRMEPENFGHCMVAQACFLDRVLLNRGSPLEPVEGDYQIEILRCMEPTLSDHLPFTLTLRL